MKMKAHFVPFIMALVVAFDVCTGTSDIAADRAALLRLRSAVGGLTLRWNDSSPTPCSWVGITCDPTTNRVTTLRLPGARLVGKIPPHTIGNLTQLRTLSLRLNFLSGPLPTDLGSCVQLRNLYLQQNNFSGAVPSSIFILSNLVRLNLAGNSFSGSIPSSFNSLTRLGSLNLENNFFTGSIPQLSLSRLSEFNVSNNQLTGSIPRNLGNFPASSFLGNFLCGSPLAPCSS